VASRHRGLKFSGSFKPRATPIQVGVTAPAGDVLADALEREIGQREKDKLTARLERALRLQVVGQLASGVAHNFNNIVSAIVGYSEMAHSEVEPGSKAARRIAEIEKAAERGRDLVDSILTFGRRSDVRSSLLSITELLSETASLLRASLPSSVELVVTDAPAGLAAFGERAVAAGHYQPMPERGASNGGIRTHRCLSGYAASSNRARLQ
jgi:signal transduction histidine kinase